MAKFNQTQQTWLFNKTLDLFENVLRTYNEAVIDGDFFEIVARNMDHAKAVKLIEKAYTHHELEAMQDKAVSDRQYGGRLNLTDSLGDIFRRIWSRKKSRPACKNVLQNICTLLRKKEIRSEGIKARFEQLVSTLKLSEVEAEVLLVSYIRASTCFDWPRRLANREKPTYFAMALDRSCGEVLKALDPNGRLRKFDILDNDFDFCDRNGVVEFLDGAEDEPLEIRFYKKVEEDAEVLPWDFYGELATGDGEALRKLLARGQRKCNILLYGAPGTGKTSFARSLAKELGRTAFDIRHGDESGRNMKPEFRLTGIRICNEREAPDESLMIIDEADALLRGGRDASVDKGVVNSLLDDMSVPTIWICNTSASAMDSSVRRRFDYSIHFTALNDVQRVSIWRNVVGKLKLSRLIPEAKIAEYATLYATSAGGIANVLKNVKRMKPAKDKVDETIATLMKAHCSLVGERKDLSFRPAKDYSLEGLNIKGDIKPDKLVRSVRNYLSSEFNAQSVDRPRMNMLLFGQPGSGKTEFVKFLGKELSREVIVMKGSDLLDPYVGMTEALIADAFERAKSKKAILFFDEIDGLLRSRSEARASWQVTQVNELLVQMENFDGVMIAATNFRENLDPAAIRRFTFKLEFLSLDPAGAKHFFERTFKTTLTEAEAAELGAIKNLTPGDFRTVRQSRFYLDEESSNAELIEALRGECALKVGADASKIGFGG